jgi:hypothetical protein
MSAELKGFFGLDSSLLKRIAVDSKTSPEIIDEIIYDYKAAKRSNARYYLLNICWMLPENKALLPKHIDFIVEEGYGSYVVNHPNFNESHIDKAIELNKVNEAICKSPKIMSRHIDILVSYKYSYGVRAAIALHPNLQSHHIDRLSKDRTLAVKRRIAERTDLKEHHVKNLLKKEDWVIYKRLQYKGYV